MKRLLILAALLCGSAQAQQPSRPSDAELDGRLGMCDQLSDVGAAAAIAAVRRNAMDTVGKLNEMIAKRDAELSKLRAEIEAKKAEKPKE